MPKGRSVRGVLRTKGCEKRKKDFFLFSYQYKQQNRPENQYKITKAPMDFDRE